MKNINEDIQYLFKSTLTIEQLFKQISIYQFYLNDSVYFHLQFISIRKNWYNKQLTSINIYLNIIIIFDNWIISRCQFAATWIRRFIKQNPVEITFLIIDYRVSKASRQNTMFLLSVRVENLILRVTSDYWQNATNVYLSFNIYLNIISISISQFHSNNAQTYTSLYYKTLENHRGYIFS